jgi:hypothetical protein
MEEDPETIDVPDFNLGKNWIIIWIASNFNLICKSTPKGSDIKMDGYVYFRQGQCLLKSLRLQFQKFLKGRSETW